LEYISEIWYKTPEWRLKVNILFLFYNLSTNNFASKSNHFSRWIICEQQQKPWDAYGIFDFGLNS